MQTRLTVEGQITGRSLKCKFCVLGGSLKSFRDTATCSDFCFKEKFIEVIIKET